MYILISIVALLVIAVIMFFAVKNKKRQKTLTPLEGLVFGFILMSVIFGDGRLVSYSLIGVGFLLAVVDIVIKLRKR